MSAYGLVACQECGAATQACIQPCNLCQSFAGQLQPPAERPRIGSERAAPELMAAIHELALKDATVHATLQACRRQGLGDANTLAHLVLSLATVKAATEAELLKLAMERSTSIVVRDGNCTYGDRCNCKGYTERVRQSCSRWVKGGAS